MSERGSALSERGSPGAPDRLRVAAAAYPATFLHGWDAYAARLRRWVAEAAGAGAELLLFPEYASLELVSLLPQELHHDIAGMRPALQALLPDFLALHRELAREFGVAIVAGSAVVGHGGGFVNRAFVFGPDGEGHQDKLAMTRFEAEEWDIAPGAGVSVFGWRGVRFGVAICYDAEFPALARAAAEGGAEVLLVPSFTETLRGYSRVRVGARARALENGMYAVHAPLVGEAPWTYAIEAAAGKSAVYTPPDLGMPETGVLAQGEWNAPGWLYADLDLGALRTVREAGQVFNFRDRGVQEKRGGETRTVEL